MASMLFTKQLLENAIASGDSSSSSVWQGLAGDGGQYGQVSTTYTSITFNRPFLKSTSLNYATLPAKFLAGGPLGATKLFVYSGERPDISTIMDMAAYESNLLISFDINGYSTARGSTGLYVEPGSTTNYQGFKAICGICTTLTTAMQGGVASWFFFGSALTTAQAAALKSGSTGNYNNVTVSPFVTGSIGTLGSGADLEIADKNIVAGQQYKSFGFNFYVPSINTVI
jgi:hypothetical protein